MDMDIEVLKNFDDLLDKKRMMAKIYKGNGYDFELYDWHTFINKSYNTGKVWAIDNSYAMHHFVGSWESQKEQDVLKKTIYFREKIPVMGSVFAFIYQKSVKAKEAVRRGGMKEFTIRLVRYVKKEC